MAKEIMAFVRRTLVLSKDLDTFAEKKVKKIARETGEFSNLSRYVRDLIRRDKEGEQKQAA